MLQNVSSKVRALFKRRRPTNGMNRLKTFSGCDQTMKNCPVLKKMRQECKEVVYTQTVCLQIQRRLYRRIKGTKNRDRLI